MRLTAASVGALKLDTDVTDKIFFDPMCRASGCVYAPAEPVRGFFSTRLVEGLGGSSWATPRQ
jgi:hypothetical protein